MSQRRQKKQLTTMENIESLTDQELREALKGYNQAPGPITDSTRYLYRKKLSTLIEQGTGDELSTNLRESPNLTEKLINGVDDDDDTSDEDYNAQDEESEDEDEEEDEEEDDLVDELEDGIKLSNLSTESDNLTTSMIIPTDAIPNRISKGILTSLVSFFALIFSAYLYFNNNYQFNLPAPLPIPKHLLIPLLAMSPLGYIVYRLIRFYKMRRHEEAQRVCNLVNDVMELLQSPDNPTGLMPILHIRDTLLTPPERKSKKMTNIWNKAVKFIEEHESRVKVEQVDIDGQGFRAWKWIGLRKL